MSLKDKWSELPIEELKVIDVSDNRFLELARKEKVNDKDTICSGWDYLTNNITKNLRDIWEKEKLNEITYNSAIADKIIEKLNINECYKDILETFVFIMRSKLSLADDKEREKNWINKGYIKISQDNKEYSGKKVSYVLRREYDGKWDKEETGMGKVMFDNGGYLFILPKRNRKKGYFVRESVLVKTI